MADEDLRGLLERIQMENATAHEETRRHFDVAVSDTKRHFDVAVSDTKRHFDVAVSDTKRHFDVAVESMEKRFDMLAESVGSLASDLRKTRTELEEKIERSALDTQAMIKFSHGELYRRLTALEETVSDLQARVVRLENSTQ